MNIISKSLCCGCEACLNACPNKAISAEYDQEGFKYPVIDAKLCVNCGICKKVCPVLNNPSACETGRVYAAKAKDSKSVLAASSGGVFGVLAEEILKRGGVVFGAAYDKNFKVVHSFAQSMQELDGLKRSKYVQSDIGGSYKKASEFLKSGRCVLFAGTPCQIAGLKNFLGKDYPLLFCADLICAGVMPPLLWRDYLAENFDLNSVKEINFRDKHFAWDKFYLRFYFKDGSVFPSPSFWQRFVVKFFEKRKIIYFFNRYYYVPFFKAFCADLACRPACGECTFKGLKKASDITMGDMWGHEAVCPEMYDGKGISALTVNSAKGAELLKAVENNLYIRQITLEQLLARNPNLLKSAKADMRRGEFFARWQPGMPPSDIILRTLGEKSLALKIFNRIKKSFKK